MQRHSKDILRDLLHKVNNKMANHDKIERLGLFVKIISNVLEEKKMEPTIFTNKTSIFVDEGKPHKKARLQLKQ